MFDSKCNCAIPETEENEPLKCPVHETLFNCPVFLLEDSSEDCTCGHHNTGGK